MGWWDRIHCPWCGHTSPVFPNVEDIRPGDTTCILCKHNYKIIKRRFGVSFRGGIKTGGGIFYNIHILTKKIKKKKRKK